MSDDPQTPSPDDGSDVPFAGVSETELDDILAQAGSMADQLSDELGHAEVAPAEPATDSVSETTGEAASLDERIAQLEGLVAATSHDVGEASVTPSPPATPEVPTENLAPERPATAWDPSAEAEFKDLFPGGELPPPPPIEVVQQAMLAPKHLNMPTSLTNSQIEPPAAGSTETPVPTEDPPAPPGDDVSAEDDQVDEDIPDFMKEFMEPEPEVPPEPEAPPASTAEPVTKATPLPVQVKPGVVGTGMLHKVVKPDEPTEQEEEAEPAAEIVALSKIDALRARLKGLLQSLRKIPSPLPALGRVVYLVCDKGVGVLEKIDKPMPRLGFRVRILIGWLAMATLGTSVVVYIISLF